MKSFDELQQEWEWRPIRNCPGRYTLAGGAGIPNIADLIGPGARVRQCHSERARDTVLVAPIPGGGIIAYQRPDGTCLYTLNTEEGFKRKLDQLGIPDGDPE